MLPGVSSPATPLSADVMGVPAAAGSGSLSATGVGVGVTDEEAADPSSEAPGEDFNALLASMMALTVTAPTPLPPPRQSASAPAPGATVTAPTSLSPPRPSALAVGDVATPVIERATEWRASPRQPTPNPGVTNASPIGPVDATVLMTEVAVDGNTQGVADSIGVAGSSKVPTVPDDATRTTWMPSSTTAPTTQEVSRVETRTAPAPPPMHAAREVEPLDAVTRASTTVQQNLAPDAVIAEMEPVAVTVAETVDLGPSSSRRSSVDVVRDEGARTSSPPPTQPSHSTSTERTASPVGPRTEVIEPATTAASSSLTTAATATPTTTPSAPSPRTDDGVDFAPVRTTNEVSDRVVTMAERVRSIDGLHRFRLEMHPGDLGAVAVELTVDGGTVHVEMVAEHVATGELLRQGFGELRTSLEAVGLQAGRLDVGADPGRQFGDTGGGFTRQSSPGASSNDRGLSAGSLFGSDAQSSSQNRPHAQNPSPRVLPRSMSRGEFAGGENHIDDRSAVGRGRRATSPRPGLGRIDIHL